MVADRLLEVLSRLPAALVEDFDLEDVMSRLGDDIAAVFGVAGAGVMLEDRDGHLRFVGASDPVLRTLERLQIELGEGPCLLAYRTGDEIHAENLEREERFPTFARKARETGMGSVFSFPVTYHGDVIGALNLYDVDPRPLPPDAEMAGRTLADVAMAYLLHARDLTHYRTENVQLNHALVSRVAIEQAKGFVQARTDLDADAAWEAIRAYARRTQTRAADVAEQILQRHLGIDELLGK
jgi:GAF domain-containing protein